MKTAFVYTDAYLNYDYGPTHPLQLVRLKLTHDLINAYGLLASPSVQSIPTIQAEEKDLAAFHSEEYLSILKHANGGRLAGNAYFLGLGPGDNPIFPGLYDLSLLVTGATIQAVDFVAEGKGEIAFNIAGGLHHADEVKGLRILLCQRPVIGIMRLMSLEREWLILMSTLITGMEFRKPSTDQPGSDHLAPRVGAHALSRNGL